MRAKRSPSLSPLCLRPFLLKAIPEVKQKLLLASKKRAWAPVCRECGGQPGSCRKWAHPRGSRPSSSSRTDDKSLKNWT